MHHCQILWKRIAVSTKEMNVTIAHPLQFQS
uniref:Uncharacterized protein n=1 Tax=Siphoviridae sp. ct8aS59 TaxID=2825365 RepID=A0A8S5TSU0_9CAUD|nr:MAG TPA: hypothetical protein [Siphoviridae sp. ct8aS59]